MNRRQKLLREVRAMRAEVAAIAAEQRRVRLRSTDEAHFRRYFNPIPFEGTGEELHARGGPEWWPIA